MQHIIIENVENPLFDTAYAIMCENFPLSERRNYKEHEKIFILNNNFMIEVLADDNFSELTKEDNSIIGILAWWNFKNFIYCEHLAIRQSRQNKGFGKVLLARLESIAKKYEKKVILEIEPPTFSEQAKKRKKFYESNGFCFNNGINHIQPPYHKETGSIELNIISWPIKITNKEYEIFKSEQKKIMPCFNANIL